MENTIFSVHTDSELILIIFITLFSMQNFAVELQAGVDNELDIELFRDALNRAGGANYGTGVRNF